MISTKRGFTLIELLVVMAIIAILIGTASVSVAGAHQRARIQKAAADVKVISQAILGYENYERGKDDFELPTMSDRDADADSLSFLLGEGESAKSGGKIPVLLMASLNSGNKLLDPWGTPYKVKIVATDVKPQFRTATGNIQTGYYLPNFYRIGEGE